MNNLTTLIKRLEAATSRLEDMAQPTGDSNATSNEAGLAPSADGAAMGATERAVAANSPVAATEVLPPSIEGFDALINAEVTKFVNLSEELGGVVAEQSSGVLRAFGAERKILIVATRARKPDVQSPLYMEILTDLQRQISIVCDIREVNRASPFFNHLSAVSDGINALGWITESKPVEQLADALSSAQFYGNRVLQEYKEKDRLHVEWVQAFYQIFKALSAYVKQHHTMGLVWNNKDGIDAKEALQQLPSSPSNAKSQARSSGGGPAPPPPPPPLPKFDNPPPPPPKGAAPPKGGDMGAVFSELNKGEAVTSGLRKVDKSEMTHKNPSLRSGATVPVRSGSQSSLNSAKGAPPGKKPKPEGMRTKKPPRKELDGSKWIVENLDNESNLTTIEASISQSILISRCRSSTIRVVGKANAISIDNSPRLELILDSLVSAVDVIRSPNVAIQVLGSLPTILLDQVDGATIYLGRASLGTELFTSKCTSVNVNIPDEEVEGEEDSEGEFVEWAVPEQIKSSIRGGRVVSEIVEHAG
ncbi:MAG: hypothetical protein M1832_001941 [Thelocarpon impressellum]|nr:MAG: hypothetical protein M1832_001941 [Thelocarpon impressellum]